MKFVWRRVPATLILSSLVFPGAIGVAAHHGAGSHHHHERADRDHAGDIELIVHGHHHDSGTPEHQHSVVVTKPAAPITKVSFTLDLAFSIAPDAAFASLAAGYPSAHVDPAHGPPPVPQNSSTLRI